MCAAEGEAFVVEHVSEVFPGLWITGMTVCAALGGPRMGPIFGGTLIQVSRHPTLPFWVGLVPIAILWAFCFKLSWKAAPPDAASPQVTTVAP